MKTYDNRSATEPPAITESRTTVDARLVGTFPTETLPGFKNLWDGFQHMAGMIAVRGQLTTEFNTTPFGEPLNDSERQLLNDMLRHQDELQSRKDAFGLTDREQGVLELIAQGKNNNQIATELFLSPHTVKSHTTRMAAKLGTSDRTGMVSLYYGLVDKVETDPHM